MTTMVGDWLGVLDRIYPPSWAEHHQAHEARVAGLVVLDAGHFGTEWPFVGVLADHLRREGLGEVLVSDLGTDPFAGGAG